MVLVQEYIVKSNKTYWQFVGYVTNVLVLRSQKITIGIVLHVLKRDVYKYLVFCQPYFSIHALMAVVSSKWFNHVYFDSNPVGVEAAAAAVLQAAGRRAGDGGGREVFRGYGERAGW